ncbi:MAG: Mini-ribonuclease 3 [Clostridia bacterium]|nr:Mini-ribonuclease 3 [Clostridia bacterium]
MDIKDANQLSALSLAFLGDSVFTLFVRSKLVNERDDKSGALHLLASGYVCAKSQALMYEKIESALSSDELAVAKRCRNAHNTSKAKNAGLADYKKATALEGLLGYLHITEQTQRLNEIMNKCVEIIDQGDSNE